jgi:hypothetical protein
VNGLFASPNFSQICISKLHKLDLLHLSVSQNHDGLLQKAGIPQEDVLEIHGAWYDPANPPVKYNEDLKTDFIQKLRNEAAEADLVLVLGTSLSGMTADVIAEKVAGRGIQGKALGTVIINLQRTRLDHSCGVRVWAKLEDAFKILEELLELREVESPLWKQEERDVGKSVFEGLVYDERGRRLEEGAEGGISLDLSCGRTFMVVDPTAVNYEAILRVLELDKNGDWVLEELPRAEGEVKKRRRLHRWWVDVGRRGRLEQFPLVNVELEQGEEEGGEGEK